MNPGLEEVAAFINVEEANQARLLRKAIAPLVQAHFAVFEAARALLDQLAPRPSTSSPAPAPTESPDLPCPSPNPATSEAQSIPQRKDTYAIQNLAIFGSSIFGRTERFYQALAAAAKNIAQQDVAATHEGRGVMLVKRENKFVLLSVIGEADLSNREFAELELALEAAAMFLSGLVSAVSGS